jgi:hypothetical protein
MNRLSAAGWTYGENERRCPGNIGGRRVDIRLDSEKHFLALTDVKVEALPDPEVKWDSPFFAVNKSVVTMVRAIKE